MTIDGRGKNYRVHRLVAQAFIPNPDNKPTVNHKDLNKDNNDVSNLEWATQKEQNVHASCNGANNIYDSESCNLSKLTKKDVLNIRKSKLSIEELSRKLNVSFTTIWRIKTKKTWIHI